jgi:hypothetical protein
VRKTCFVLAVLFFLAGSVQVSSSNDRKPLACAVTPTVHLSGPSDPGVDPLEGDWYVNADRSIWAMYPPYPWRRGGPWLAGVGEKIPWIRPAGVPLAITGRRLDGESSPLEVTIPGVYQTRFTPSGILFPSAGCWEVIGKAGEKELRFITLVGPKPSRK